MEVVASSGDAKKRLFHPIRPLILYKGMEKVEKGRGDAARLSSVTPRSQASSFLTLHEYFNEATLSSQLTTVPT